MEKSTVQALSKIRYEYIGSIRHGRRVAVFNPLLMLIQNILYIFLEMSTKVISNLLLKLVYPLKGYNKYLNVI